MSTATNKESTQLPYPYGDASGDEQVLAAVLNALHFHSGVPQEQVKVDVKHGHVVLSGVVTQAYERELAERTAAEAPGVVGVTNQITVES